MWVICKTYGQTSHKKGYFTKKYKMGKIRNTLGEFSACGGNKQLLSNDSMYMSSYKEKNMNM